MNRVQQQKLLAPFDDRFWQFFLFHCNVLLIAQIKRLDIPSKTLFCYIPPSQTVEGMVMLVTAVKKLKLIVSRYWQEL